MWLCMVFKSSAMCSWNEVMNVLLSRNWDYNLVCSISDAIGALFHKMVQSITKPKLMFLVTAKVTLQLWTQLGYFLICWENVCDCVNLSIDLPWLLIHFIKLVEELLQRIFTLVANLRSKKSSHRSEGVGSFGFFPSYSINSNIPPLHPASKQYL